MDEKSQVIAAVCDAVSSENLEKAAALLEQGYPFAPQPAVARRYGDLDCMRVFVRDGFIDRYSGQRLIFPPVLRMLSQALPAHFPFHTNWKTDECHFAYYELTPTVDHEIPVSRGGADDESNLVSTSMLRNMAKSNFLLSEIGWTKHPPGDFRQWDGLTAWFLAQMQKHPNLYKNFRRWELVAQSVVTERYS